MRRKTFKEAVEIRNFIKYGTLDKAGILEKYKLSDKAFERIIKKETLKAPAKKRRAGTNVKGEKCGASKLTKMQVYRALNLHHKGVTQSKIAKKLNISSSAVGKVIRCESWSTESVSFYNKKLGKITAKVAALNTEKKKVKRRLTDLNRTIKNRKSSSDVDVKAILFYKGILTYREMVEMVENRISFSSVGAIIRGETHKHLQRGK